jgi:hypothetical protein
MQPHARHGSNVETRAVVSDPTAFRLFAGGERESRELSLKPDDLRERELPRDRAAHAEAVLALLGIADCVQGADVPVELELVRACNPRPHEDRREPARAHGRLGFNRHRHSVGNARVTA